jgi:hypothetical protein
LGKRDVDIEGEGVGAQLSRQVETEEKKEIEGKSSGARPPAPVKAAWGKEDAQIRGDPRAGSGRRRTWIDPNAPKILPPTRIGMSLLKKSSGGEGRRGGTSGRSSRRKSSIKEMARAVGNMFRKKKMPRSNVVEPEGDEEGDEVGGESFFSKKKERRGSTFGIQALDNACRLAGLRDAESARSISIFSGPPSEYEIIVEPEPRTGSCACLQSIPVIHPRSKFRQWWNMLMVCLLLYTATAVPYRAAFGVLSSGAGLFVEIIFACVYLLDIVVNFCTGFDSSNQSEHGKPAVIIMEHIAIAKRYVRSYFVADVIAILPLNFIILNGFYSGSAQVLEEMESIPVKYVHMIMLLQLVRFVGVYRYMKIWFVAFNPSFVQLIKFPMQVIIVCHYLGCMFFVIGESASFGSGKSWMTKIRDHEAHDQYVTSMYWAVSTVRRRRLVMLGVLGSHAGSLLASYVFAPLPPVGACVVRTSSSASSLSFFSRLLLRCSNTLMYDFNLPSSPSSLPPLLSVYFFVDR